MYSIPERISRRVPACESEHSSEYYMILKRVMEYAPWTWARYATMVGGLMREERGWKYGVREKKWNRALYMVDFRASPERTLHFLSNGMSWRVRWRPSPFGHAKVNLCVPKWGSIQSAMNSHYITPSRYEDLINCYVAVCMFNKSFHSTTESSADEDYLSFYMFYEIWVERYRLLYREVVICW
jgi:hypothetical protein